MFALQYITATDGLKISYHSDADLKQHSNSTFKRKVQQQLIKDTECSFGPPAFLIQRRERKVKKAKENVSQIIQKKRQRKVQKKLKCCMPMASGIKDGYQGWAQF